MLQRDPHSHKGENGKVAVIGGSRFIHGAPLFSALAAESSGVDLVYVALPACHEEIAKSTSLNFQVHPFVGNDIGRKDRQTILQILATMDCAVIGPGIWRTEESVQVLLHILSAAPCALVLDASALQRETLSFVRGKNAVLTPHRGELERMGAEPEEIGQLAAEHGVVLHLKGPTDLIADPSGTVTEVAGGNAGLTVGGTGDALAGLIAGLLAQRVPTREACLLASRTIKRAGDLLAEEQGTAFTTHDVIEQIPFLLQEEA